MRLCDARDYIVAEIREAGTKRVVADKQRLRGEAVACGVAARTTAWVVAKAGRGSNEAMNAAIPSDHADHAALEAAMTAEQRAAEPSMEEILASIRRIITDDDVLPMAARGGPGRVDPAPQAAVFPAASSPPVLTLVAPPAPIGEAARPRDADSFDAALNAAAEPPDFAPHQDEARRHAANDAEPIVSHDTSLAVHASFETLAATVMAQNAAMIEESIRAMLRPMLKGWLDDNLPVIVEKLVRAEIERVARGGR